MRFIHIADLHAHRNRLKESLKVLEQVREKAADTDAVLFGGDFFDALITDTEASGFTSLVSAVGEIARCAPVYMIYGTPSHEPSGCLDIFRAVGCNVYSAYTYEETPNFDLILIPEPRKVVYRDEDSLKSSLNDFINSIPQRHDRDRPRIVLYHGEVGGAVYQNGVSAECSYALTKEQLLSMQADYYALGHIHKPQEVFENARYVGSSVPLNYGEEHDGHCNIVTVDKGNVSVDEFSFGFPRNLTMTEEEYRNRSQSWLGGMVNLRIVFRRPKAEYGSALIDFNKLNPMSKCGCRSVKFAFEPVENYSARSEKIRNLLSYTDKMREYAAVSGVSIPDGAVKILEAIESTELVREPVPVHSFELLRVRLKGSKGIKIGRGKIEVDVDFTKFSKGLISLCGENGSGKTTFLENCTPYPFLLTRGGPLREHFYAEASVRETEWRDERGKYYRLRISLDASKACGRAKYEAWTSPDRENWTPAIDVDGSLSSYTKYVNSVFGPVDLYMRTAFQAKEKSLRVSDISDATKGERIELFSALAGISQMKSIAKAARERAKCAIMDSIDAEASLKAAEEVSNTEYLEVRIIKADRLYRKAEILEMNCEEKYNKILETDAKTKALKKANEANRKLADDLKKRIVKSGIEIGKKTQELNKIESYFGNIKQIRQYRAAVIRRDEAKDKNTKATGVLNELYVSNSDVSDEIHEKDAPLNEIERTIGSLNTKIATLEETSVEVGDRCPVCGAMLTEQTRSELLLRNFEASRGIETLKSNLRAIKTRKTKIENQLVKLRDKQNEIQKEIKKQEALVKSAGASLHSAEMQLGKYIQYKPEREYTEEERAVLRREIKEIESEQSKDRKSLEEIVIEEPEDVTDMLDEAKMALDEAKADAAEKLAELKALQKQKKAGNDIEKKIKEWKKKKDDADKATVACRFIEAAFGQKGIPALELENTAPEIADTANILLKGIRDGRYTVSIKPLRENSDIADFEIIVTDSDSKYERSLDLVCSGERVWIKQALYGAFSIVLARQTGLNYKVRFIDEADGALYADRRGEFLDMIKKAAELSGAEKTVIITQSQEIMDCIEQSIEL